MLNKQWLPLEVCRLFLLGGSSLCLSAVEVAAGAWVVVVVSSPLLWLLSEHLQGSDSGRSKNLENRSQGILSDPGWPSFQNSLSPPGDSCLHSSEAGFVSPALCVFG